MKLWGVWQPTFFKGNNALDKLLGGWTVSGILNWHSGFPWTPLYRTTGGCNIIYSNSGVCTLRPSSYLGGAGNSFDNDVFMMPGGQFQGGSDTFFTPVTYQQNTDGAWPPAAVGAIPAAPGVGRNTFRGPHYLNVDMTFAKAFGLPKLPFFGESSQIEFRASAYNVFNKLNLRPFGFNSNSTFVGTVTPENPTNPLETPNLVSPNGSFGQAEGALGGRVVELQARFSF